MIVLIKNVTKFKEGIFLINVSVFPIMSEDTSCTSLISLQQSLTFWYYIILVKLAFSVMKSKF